jgi:hypothetical protein
MAEHRIRLTDEDVTLITSALAGRWAGSGEHRKRHIERLIARLSDGGSGNPEWRLGPVPSLAEWRSER